MKKDNLFHIANISVLVSVLGASILGMYIFRGWPDYQMITVIGFSLFYFIWGCIFHLIKGDFHTKIMLEYLLISVIAVLLLRGALYR